jgi:flagellar hook protein FlgE
MFTSFYKTLSGLNAFREELSVISNNIANTETTAYKSSSASFAEVLSASTSASSSGSEGSGVSVQSINSNWEQGSIVDTGNSTDLAITGSGFFIVEDASGSTYYTRDGEFSYGDDGTLESADGLTVQGYLINDDGTLGSLEDITTSSFGTLAATSTSEINTSLNLNSAAETDDSFSATVNGYDSLGNEIAITIDFTKSASNEWSWTASIPSGTGTATGSGTLTFDSDGELQTGTDPTISLTLSNGATTPQTITWNLYDDSGGSNGTLTQYASDSSLSDQSQNGTTVGTLKRTSIDNKGVITGSYSNGETKELFQIALADFASEDGLGKVGDSLYETTASSGEAVIGVAGSGQYGSLTSGSLEGSNVDLASEMANMIIAQRAYESCAKMFTTESEIMQVTINMVK